MLRVIDRERVVSVQRYLYRLVYGYELRVKVVEVNVELSVALAL